MNLLAVVIIICGVGLIVELIVYEPWGSKNEVLIKQEDLLYNRKYKKVLTLCELGTLISLYFTLTWENYILSGIIIYFIFGIARIMSDFREPSINQPEYVRHFLISHILTNLFIWPLLIALDLSYYYQKYKARRKKQFTRSKKSRLK